MIADVPGRGLVEIVPAMMLVSGPACKDYCYKNFIMCGDHRAQTSDKLVMWKAATKSTIARSSSESAIPSAKLRDGDFAHAHKPGGM